MRSTVRLFLVSSTVFIAAVALSAAGQPPAPPAGGGAPGARAGGPPTPQNLKVLPKDWTNQQVGALMQTFVTSLGLTNPDPGQTGPGPGCGFCHAADPNAPPPAAGRGPRLKYDLDDKPEKEVARKMIQMVMAINAESLKGVGDATVPEKVTCFTCHNGQKKPAIAPPNGWGRGSFTLLPPGPVVAPRGGGPAGPGGPGGAPGGMAPTRGGN